MRVISDEYKMAVLNCFESERPLTVTEISDRLSIPYSRLNYHVKGLERIGILEVVDTRIKSGIIEKYYLPTAKEFKIDKSISISDSEGKLDEHKDSVRSYYDSVFKGISEDFRNFVKIVTIQIPETAFLLNSTIFLSDADVKALGAEVDGFIKQLEQEYGTMVSGASTKVYSLISCLLPKKNQKQYEDEPEEELL